MGKNMNRGRAATRKDVATKAGVAPSTVSLVLNKTPGMRIPPETRRRVEEAAQALGYQSSAIARALVTGRTQTIGIVLHFIKQPFQAYASGVLDGVWDELSAQGYRMLISSGTTEACAAGLFRERNVDGVLLIAPPVAADDAELRDLVRSGFPAVCIGARPDSCADRISYADIDNVAAGYRSTDLLLQAGHRDILHVAGPLALSSVARDRLTGVRMALAERDLQLRDDHIIDASWNVQIAEERIGAAFDRGVRCTAMVAANGNMAQGAIRALQARGMRIPADISVTAIDAPPRDNPHGVIVTRLDQPLYDIGQQAARLLAERINDPKAKPRTVLLPFREVAGSSIAPPPGR
jgi:DNA-binding LacI/PurR family transcriptional regulator